jgi:Icc-related predicted phosphoesterase
MKIQIVSDLHLEFGDIEIKNNGADVLVLSGDICVAQDLYDHPDVPSIINLGRRQAAAKLYREFFARVSKEFDEVVYVAGNHEFYHGKWKKTHQILAHEMERYGNIHYLDISCTVIRGVTFLGGTLWTDMNKGDPLTMHGIADMMNDFQVIRDDTKGYSPLKPFTVAMEHRKTVQYISAVVEGKHEDKFVVVGHHAPSFLSVHESYRSETLMNGAYASDLSDFILDRPQIKLWTHGHMHDPSDYMMGTTRVVANPRGYVGYVDTTAFDPQKVVEI